MLKKVMNLVLLIVFTLIYNVGAITITSTYCEKMGETNYIVKCCCCDHEDSHNSCCDTKITVDQNEYESTSPTFFSFDNYQKFFSHFYINSTISNTEISKVSTKQLPPLNSNNPPS